MTFRKAPQKGAFLLLREFLSGLSRLQPNLIPYILTFDLPRS